MNNKTCLTIVGPTSVGKTAFSIALAKQINSDIISADSRQCYQELNIGVAKPDIKQLQSVDHYFINSHSIMNEVNAKIFEDYALNKSQELFSTRDYLLLVGGTGLYVKAFCEGLDNIPPVDTHVTEEIKLKFDENGLPWLQEELKKHDPEFYARGEIFNPHRVIRALSVKISTGMSILQFQTKIKKQRPFNIIKIGLELPREKLNENINTRVDKMIQEGLLEEVRALAKLQHLLALQTVGYQELFEFIQGRITLKEAIEQIKINTRQYAKRQMTWFKKDQDIKWLDASMAHDILIEEALKLLNPKI